MRPVIVIGGGPAGLMAADVVSAAGLAVTVYERMPSVGRKLLLAGRGGLNLTHSEPIEPFLGRYGAARASLEGPIRAYPPDALRAFAEALGEPTFVGSSGRVFPRAMKASPLLRAWLARLARQGVVIRTRRRLIGLDGPGRVMLADPDGAIEVAEAAAVVLALGGGSWPRLGSDGSWVDLVRGLGVAVRPLTSANVGAEIAWSEHFRTHFQGQPLKRIAVSAGRDWVRGEAVVTAGGLEGGVIYALTPQLRDEIQSRGRARITIDLRPDLDTASLAAKLAGARGKQSLSSWLRKAARLSPAAIGLLREGLIAAMPSEPGQLAQAIKATAVEVTALAGLARAISSAGGVALDQVREDMMLEAAPGVFVAGEMLDWEAPTGGYLLQGCFATGYAAGCGVLGYLGCKPVCSAANGYRSVPVSTLD